MKTRLIVIIVGTLLFCTTKAHACGFDGNEVNAGSLTPTVAYQTQTNVTAGQYFSVAVTCGNSYNFNFCNNGGSAAWDTQITILNVDGVTEYAANDDNCGLQSDVSWTADFTGTVYVLITQYNCNLTSGSTGATLAYNGTVGSPDASFTLSQSCGGASANITGDTGGTFAWNPADPGDGAVLNTSTGQITGGVQGTTYTVDYTVCSTTTTESVVAPSSDCWTLNGDAQYITIGGEQCIQLTDAVNAQTGCAWNGSQIDFASDFSLTLDYYFGNNINGADGNTFTFQPSSSTACGTAGGQLGAGGLVNALSIEFDTYDNDNPAHVFDMACDHVAVEIDGNLNGPGAPLCGPVCAKSGGGNIDDGGTYQVDIVWNSGTQQLDIYFDGNLRLSCTNDFVTNAFGGTSSVYWGATSATGGFNNQQYFCPSTIIILPAEMTSFSSHCSGDTEIFEWETASENRVEFFQLEYTYDGLLFQPVGKVEAVGQSQETQFYQLAVYANDEKQRYYRIKTIDEDGAFEYSDLVKSEQCGAQNRLIESMTQTETAVSFQYTEKSTIVVTNQLGQVVLTPSDNSTTHTISSNALSSGVYYVRVQGVSGKVDSEKFMINRF